MRLGQKHAPADGRHHHNRHLLEKFEGATDLLVVGMIIVLGLVMFIGLATAGGKVTW
jgi:hypothetical protein